RWRGAAPVERAIAAGDTRTGVTLMRIDEGLDTGPVIAERATDIADDDTGGTLTARLAYLGARVVDDTMPGYLLGRRLPVPQIAAGSTQARSLSRDEARIASTLSAIVAERRIRAFTPRPGAWCGTVDGALKLRGVGSIVERAPAGVISLVDGAVVFGFSDGGIELTTVQPAGKPAMDAQAWMHGRRGEPAAVVD
ncbi:MAG: methionyl-tRNA formyltransferase, partial [Acidimicrobiia bacterium]|nr:methionyl-tRNA formyltransferase [Acidimicrobiia bacterium]